VTDTFLSDPVANPYVISKSGVLNELVGEASYIVCQYPPNGVVLDPDAILL